MATPKCCTVSVVNWEKYQHYKNRNPPWIKFYNSLLEDPAVAVLPDAAKAHTFGIWLLASRLQNRIPADADFIGKRINATEPVDLKLLLAMAFIEWSCGCLQHASKPLATCATEQSRAETEEKRVEQTEDVKAESPAGPNGVALDVFVREVQAAFLRKTGRPQEFGPVEFQLAKRWYERGDPLRVVVTAIDETKGIGRRLMYYAGSVDDELKRWRRATA